MRRRSERKVNQMARKSLVSTVADALLDQIVSGELGPGDALPSEAELCEQFDVSRVTVRQAVQRLKEEPGRGLFVGGVQLPLALAELGLIDEYEFVVHPKVAGHGPTLLAGLSKPLDLKLVGRREFGSGAVAMRYEPKR